MSDTPLAQCIALIGPSGSGKSTVGALLARQLGWLFTDLDALIEERAGCSIPTLFEQEGEAGFRDRESAALAKALERGPLVLSCGGGVVLRRENRVLLRQHAWCVFLTSHIDVLVDRLRNDPANIRPLLVQATTDHLLILVGERRPMYAALANWTVHTDKLDAAGVVREVLRGWQISQPAAPFVVAVHGGRYELKVGPLAALPAALGQLGLRGACWLMSDTTVGPLYAAPLRAALAAAGFGGADFLVGAGEQSKTVAVANEVYTWLLEQGVQRGDTIIALGGGVVGDLAGFVAATILRGVALVQIPTTILAMIDSSLGGKTGVNHERGKNLIGAFHQPRLVLADPAVLATLPQRERAAGWAEAVKHGVIADAALFDDLERRGAALNDLPALDLADLLARAAAVKIGVVNRDEREQGERMLLNYGHTLGQAVEAATGYARYLHGEAVAIGMTFAAELAVRRGSWAAADAARQRSLLTALGLPTALPADIDSAALLAALFLDKKRADGRLRWVLPTAIGHAIIDDQVPVDLVEALVREAAG